VHLKFETQTDGQQHIMIVARVYL